MKRASVHVERTRNRPAAPQPVCINPTSSLAAEWGACLCINTVISLGLLFHLWTLASKEYWPYSCSLPFFEAHGFALQIKVKTFIKKEIWPTAPQTQPRNKALKGSNHSGSGVGREWRLSWAFFLRSCKAAPAWHSASLWVWGNFTRRVCLPQQKGVSYRNIPNLFCSFYLKQALS